MQSEAADDSDDDSDPDNDPASGAVLRGSAQSEVSGVDPRRSGSDVSADEVLMEATRRQLDALFRYSVTGDSAYLLAPQRPLMAAQDEDGDTSVHTRIHTHTLTERCWAHSCSALLQWAASGGAAQPAGGADKSDPGCVRSDGRGGAQHEEPPVPGSRFCRGKKNQEDPSCWRLSAVNDDKIYSETNQN